MIKFSCLTTVYRGIGGTGGIAVIGGIEVTGGTGGIGDIVNEGWVGGGFDMHFPCYTLVIPLVYLFDCIDLFDLLYRRCYGSMVYVMVVLYDV